MKTRLLLVLISLFTVFSAGAQCPSGFDRVVVEIVPDAFPSEISWTLSDINGATLLSGVQFSDSVCVPAGSCLRFRIEDTYGDGICCSHGNGSYTVLLNGIAQVTGGNYGHSEERYIGCPAGTNCDNPFTAFTDTLYQASGRSTWYTFTPDSTGTYNISTCFPNNLCNTQLWVYDHCQGLQFDTTNIGSLFFNDSACGDLAFINAGLMGGFTYYIRVGGDYSCADSIIDWQITYNGPVVGCTDSTACNFNPLATVDNGTCVYPGDPDCNSGPDLAIDQNAIQNTLAIGTVNGNDACLIGEGCLAGYGIRNIIRFTTTIRNIGDADYYIGQPQTGNSQFVFDQCHGHWHYAGYASYELYDSLQQPLSVGFKNGFCVLDLSCFGGTAKYGCGNMGISAGCADTYGSGLSCQWIDITDVPAGKYTLVVKVNWDRSPDKLGRIEQRFDNNVAYVCVNIARNAQNVPSITQIPGCQPIIDCTGDTFGLALADCEGICNGSRLSGDLNQDTLQDAADVTMYMDSIADSGAVMRCNDLNNDSLLTVADAALLNGCIRNTNGNHTHPGGTQNTHRHCQFPYDVLNTTDTVRVGIGFVNTTQKYIDLQVLNKDCDLLALDLSLSDVIIDSVVSLVGSFDPLITWNALSGRIVILDTAETRLIKQLTPVNCFRVYYSALTSNTICVNTIHEAVNGDYEKTLHGFINGCETITGINVAYNSRLIKVQPNPSTGIFTVSAEAFEGMEVKLSLTDAMGRAILSELSAFETTDRYELDLSGFPSGVYLIRIRTGEQLLTHRIVKM